MSRAVTASMPYDCRNGGLKAIRGCCTNAYDRSSASCSVRPAKSITTSVRRRGEAGEGSCCCSKNREDRREDSSSCRLGNLGREPGAAAAAAMAAVVGPVPVPGPGASPREAIRTRSGCTAKYDANCCATSNCKAAPMACRQHRRVAKLLWGSGKRCFMIGEAPMTPNNSKSSIAYHGVLPRGLAQTQWGLGQMWWPGGEAEGALIPDSESNLAHLT